MFSSCGFSLLGLYLMYHLKGSTQRTLVNIALSNTDIQLLQSSPSPGYFKFLCNHVLYNMLYNLHICPRFRNYPFPSILQIGQPNSSPKESFRVIQNKRNIKHTSKKEWVETTADYD